MIVLIFMTKKNLHTLNFFGDFKFQTHFFQKCVHVGKDTFVYQ